MTLRTSGLYMKIDCLTSVQNLSVDNLKFLGFRGIRINKRDVIVT